MQMDGWTDYLHVAFYGEHVLFPAFRLDSAWHFVVASIFTALLCLAERALTYAINKNWTPFACTRRSRFRRAVWKSVLYWVVTFARLLYMLVAMTFSIGLILVSVTSLSVGQFVIEYLDNHGPDHTGNDVETVKEPLLSSSPTSRDQQSPVRRLRSKSKPASIFIHPAQSNIARADAAAIHMGLAWDTELVKGNMHAPGGEPAWKIGRGKDLARQMMRRGGAV
ncbi:uncharacterized protein PHACADRAFT_135311 [Phanerochaete carnosa HHB-10118-sp]|uniref:Copper transporter n=1 Tax=Phanerochaete carnosa (strain HHB-10118-sp) TaxID=650164 RepID=K5XEP1_PHACS|nr:uncharacterized protein PHACADRAFT_135311 [Phanerochaete carnosa HHB-10118-sp]EKM61552.1 hypothetical protein PHACADRAFT_135311 [Phanerochaete carnosa HHB-10118-sp]